jgi:competence protein ComEC
MPVEEQDNLSIFVLNVGEADTIVIRTPKGKIAVIDAAGSLPGGTAKLVDLLTKLGMTTSEDSIEVMIITHPHFDHCSAAYKLLGAYKVNQVILAPFWHDEGWGDSATYRELIAKIEQKEIPVHFLAGYSRVYLEDLDPPGTGHYSPDEIPRLEILGPPNSLVERLEKKEGYTANHLSIITKLVWEDFSMVLAADAQMENWAVFDSEGMLEGPCDVLKAAHHGSKNGTQWERLDRLQPEYVIVSSYPDGRHDIPDLVGCSIFKAYRENNREISKRPFVAMTHNTGTLEIDIAPGGNNYQLYSYGDERGKAIVRSDRTAVNKSDEPTKWTDLLSGKI